MLMPASIDELQRMVDDRVQESIHLDYKASQACDPNRPTEIAKDISSFANSDGGVVIYGVEEEKDTGFPLRVDGGVDPKVPKERLENIITDHVTPRVDCEIIPLPLAGGRAVFVVRIGKSFSGPHQASDKKYYKRHNFKSAPMEDYEINDVRSRPKRVPPLVTFDPKAGRELHIALRNNYPSIQNYVVELSGAGLTFLPARSEISIAVSAEREIVDRRALGKRDTVDVDHAAHA
jgi:hypothetical protein